MGNWNETCILSRLPIEEKEYCIMLVGVNKNFLENLFNIDKLTSMFNFYPYPNMRIYKGIYGGRGTLEGMKEFDNTVFINYSVWIWLELKFNELELARTKQGYTQDLEEDIKRFDHKYKEVDKQLLWQYFRVSYSASLLRLIPNVFNLKGATDIRLKEFAEWLNLLTNLNNNKIKYYEEI